MKKIYITEYNKTMGNKIYKYRGAIVKESLMQSVLSDLFTFGTIVLSFAVNAYFIHSRLLSGLLLSAFLFMLMSTKKEIVTKEEFLKRFEEMIN